MHAKLHAFEDKEACALEPKSKNFHSKIVPLSKALEESKKYRLPLQKDFATNGSRNDLIIFNPPLTHLTTRITTFFTLIIDLATCRICNTFYVKHKFVVASCDYLYYLWCIAIHV